ncbi:uncharacterized protein ARMOST_02047 [Armillaria ostoyae]|uniref:Uncharacterized protein n=1 Tax=Armillaria ostoyae TaxID=47428 RepID=A0A284QQP6_ARMOS|nr:uncharacterized protein ARMOST_02047 [Armillaria ostoyae]
MLLLKCHNYHAETHQLKEKAISQPTWIPIALNQQVASVRANNIIIRRVWCNSLAFRSDRARSVPERENIRVRAAGVTVPSPTPSPYYSQEDIEPITRTVLISPSKKSTDYGRGQRRVRNQS